MFHDEEIKNGEQTPKEASVMPDEPSMLAACSDETAKVGQISPDNPDPVAPTCPGCGDCDGCGGEKSTPSPEEEAENAPVEVVGIRFRQSGKVYFFAPGTFVFEKGEGAVVETARGPEYGKVAMPNRTIRAKVVVAPLRPVIRRATAEDVRHHEENLAVENEAYNVCLEKIEEMKLDMKLVDVEFTFDNSKLLFYFTADGRIDFRDLVKYLAGVFRTRIELRQIGIRDEAKMRGGLGICGRPFCCGTFLSDFAQVSIKMAKDQSLSLNSSKISGTCGRLMCCLRYEYDTYVEEIARTPKTDSVVTTPDGDGYIMETSPLTGMCRVKLLAPADAQPKYYHRDVLTPKGIMKKDLGPLQPTRPGKEDKTAEGEKGKRGAAASRRPARRERPARPERPAEQPKPAEGSKKSEDREKN